MDIYTKDAINNKLTKKQDTLVSGTNIKTINGNSLLGSGDVTISGSGSGDSVASADFSGSNTQLNGLSINGTNYKLLDIKVNNGTNLIIGNNRSLASSASGAVAIGDCGSSTASGSASIAIGYSSLANGDSSVAIGYNSKVYVPNQVSFDGTTNDLVRTVALKSTDNIFFRNENVDNTKTTQASYTNGKTLTEVLNENQGDKLVRINITGISDETTGKNDNSLVFVGFRNLINTALETLGLDLDTLSSNWQTLMTGEYASTIWAGLVSLLTEGVCFSCFYTIDSEDWITTVSPIMSYNYLGYVEISQTAGLGRVVFNIDSDMKAAFAESTMELDKELEL